MLRFSLAFLLCLSGVSLHAVTLSAERAGDFALKHNATLIAARLRVEEARGRVVQSGRMANPELEVGFAQNVRGKENATDLSFVQRFPLTSRLRLEREISRAELMAAEAEVRDAERIVAGEARTGAVKILANLAQIRLRQQQLENSRTLVDFTWKRVETGEASTLDVAALELDTNQLQAELLQLEVQQSTLLGELRPVLGVKPGEDLGVQGELRAPSPVVSRSGGVDSRPDIEVARATVRAARSSAELARAQKWEDIGVGLTYQRERGEDAPEGLETDRFVGLRVSLPLPLWNDNAGRIREAEAAAVRRGKEAEALALTVHAQIQAAQSELVALARLVTTLQETLLPKAREIEEQLRLAQTAGQVPVGEVLRARSRQLQLEGQRLDALRDYHLARVRLETASGTVVPSGRTRFHSR